MRKMCTYLYIVHVRKHWQTAAPLFTNRCRRCLLLACAKKLPWKHTLVFILVRSSIECVNVFVFCNCGLARARALVRVVVKKYLTSFRLLTNTRAQMCSNTQLPHSHLHIIFIVWTGG